MRITRFQLLSLVLLISFCIHGSASVQRPAWTLVRIPEGFGVVIDARVTPKAFPLGEGGYGGTWTPTADDVRKTEEALLDVRDASPPEVTPSPAVDIEALVSRQYFGLVSEDTRLLYVNGFCSGGLPADPSQMLLVSDGGSCYWRATVDARIWQVMTYRENGNA